MAISGGFRIHDEGVIRRFRVPDLLTENEFKFYMASVYGVGVDFRSLTDAENEQINSGEVLVSIISEPSGREREIEMLREKLGINELEKKIGTLDPGILNIPTI